MIIPGTPGSGLLRSLNLADNNLGQIVEGLLPDGWKSKDDDDAAPWLRIEDGHEQDEHPNAKPEGIIAIANAIPNMSAMTSLNLSGNGLGAVSAKHIAEGIEVSKCVYTAILAPFSCPLDHWLNCCY
jgi:hypothetical protein